VPVPVVAMGDGIYHVPGSLVPAPISIIRKALQNCDSIAAVVKDSNTILIGPSPRYVSRRCCAATEHLENYDSPDYESEILRGIETINNTFEKWAIEQGLSFRLVDPTEQSEPAEFPLGERVAPDGSSWWASSDPVHLSRGGYQVLASVCTTPHTSDDDLESTKDSSASSTTRAGSSAHSSAGKRKRVDSVVVTAPQRGWRGRSLGQPGWLRGSTDNATAPRGGSMHRGRQPHWRGGLRSRPRAGNGSRFGRYGRSGRW
jgi:hypothetical protein